MTAVEFSPRAEWNDIPEDVRTGIEKLLGFPVIDAVNQDVGFSPGLAARVRCADGSRAFIKAVGPELNPISPGMYRDEAHRARQLPADFPAPRLRDVFDDGSWVALVFDEIDGRLPTTPWELGELETTIDALTELAERGTPSPVKDISTAADELADDFAGYARLAAAPPADLDPWEARHLERLAALSRESLHNLTGDTLVHLDVRADNVLLGRDGRVYFVDWPFACTGARWIDTTLVLMNAAYYGRDPEWLAQRSKVFQEADPQHVSGFLAGVAGMFADHSRRPAPPGLPTIREFQRAQLKVTLDWLKRRLPWPAE